MRDMVTEIKSEIRRFWETRRNLILKRKVPRARDLLFLYCNLRSCDFK